MNRLRAFVVQVCRVSNTLIPYSFFLSFCILVVLFPSVALAKTASLTLKSPTGTLTARLAVDSSGTLEYSIDRGTAHVLLPSRLGLDPYSSGFAIVSSVRTQHLGSWHPLYGERNTIPDNYNQLAVKLVQHGGRTFALEIRAYDAGIALRYGVTEAAQIHKELTEFHFPAGSFAYEEHGTEGEYSRNPISKIAPHSQTPLTVELPDGGYAAILEAANVDFPEMTVVAERGHEDALLAELGSSGTLPAGGFTPWRLLMFAKTPGEMLEHNYLELDLNAKQALDNVSWIKPGTAIREMTLSTEGSRKLIDFAAAHHIPYIGLDAGWYGPEDYAIGDATHERTVDQRGQPAPPLNIQEVVQYGRTHGVGVFVYIDHRQAEKQRDILFPLYEKWGLAGVKIGFVNVGTQPDTTWITETVRKAAEHHLMLDIHDQYRTTGYTRTYPNLLTVEGIRGNEHFPTPEHNATLPFTRYLAGSADYTICYYTPRLVNTTHAHQLAMSVISYSPLQWIFWYDKPSDYHGEPEIKWLEQLPTVWDETRVPLGEIGKYAVVARRSHNDWYVGAISGNKSLTLHLPMKFLRTGVVYRATIYRDNPTIQTATKVEIEERRITADDVLALPLQDRGGVAVYLTPETAKKD